MPNDLLIKTFQPKIDKGLNKPANVKELHRRIGRFLDVNSNTLLKSGPVHRHTFSDEDKEAVYEAVEMRPEEVKEFLKKNPGIKHDWNMLNDPPFAIICVLAVRHFTLKKDTNNTILMRNYFMLSLYPMLHHKYFKFNATESIMDYTINNLSNKFKIKQGGTMYNTLSETVDGSYSHHRNVIVKGEDKDLKNFAMDIKTRVNSLLKNVAREYYDNHEKQNFMNADSDNFDPDNYHETDSNIYAIDRISTKVTMRLVTNGPNVNMVSMAARWCKVSVNELRNYTTKLVNSEERDQIQTMNESILYLYLFSEKNKADDIKNNTNFLVYCLEMYKKSNTTDKNIIKIKAILDKWLEQVGTYKKTQRVATINDFRRALFLFFVISIMNYA